MSDEHDEDQRHEPSWTDWRPDESDEHRQIHEYGWTDWGPDERSLEPGARVGPYTVRAPIGLYLERTYLADGADGPVELALFVLPDIVVTDIGVRFERELAIVVKTLSTLHPAIRPLYAAGLHGPLGWIARAPAAGVPLPTWRAATPRTWSDLFPILQQVAGAITSAEQAGLLLPPLVPEDILVEPGGGVQVDLGTVLADHHACLGDQLNHPRTFLLLSPEAVRGEPPSPRSSQFSICALAWFVFHGQRPFASDSIVAYMFATLEGRLREPPPGTALPSRIHQALVRGLAAEPADRWPTMPELLAALAPRKGLLGWLRR
ncbi:MAG: hypothetical protein H0T76_23760 [Nannocystis sp.]|nr:hypothetical protein [Nannocystis sp.]MBA3549503.1 hypothetical protein [Nannocystis sp.]